MPRSSTPPPIRVVPVDDSAFAHEGLRAILKLDRGIDVVGQACSRARAIEEVHRTKPDVVIMDMRLPDGTGADACRDIISAFPRMRILFFSAYSDDRDLYDAVMAGGHGYLTKDVGAKDLLRAIKTIAAGRSLSVRQRQEDQWVRLQPASSRKLRESMLGALLEFFAISVAF